VFEKMKEWKKILFGIAIFLFCILPITAKAADYEAGFKLYRFNEEILTEYPYDTDIYTDEDEYNSYISEIWFEKLTNGEVEEVTKNTTLQEGDTIVVANTLKSISANPQSTTFTLYYFYDKDIFDALPYSWFDSRNKLKNGYFTSNTWLVDSLRAENGEGTATFRDGAAYSKQKPFTSTDSAPVSFLFYKVKEGATPGATINFRYITNENVSESAYPLVTESYDRDGETLSVNTVDNSMLSIQEAELDTTSTLDSVVATSGGNSYTFTKNASGEYEGIVPSTVSSLDFVITPTSNKALVSSTELTGTTVEDTTKALSGSYSTISVGDNTFTVNVMPESGETAIYTIKIKKLSDVATLESLTLTNVTGFTFNQNTTTYSNLTVPYKTNSTTITAQASNGAVIQSGLSSITNNGVNGSESWSLNQGANNKTIRVEAENCQSSYTSVPGNTCSYKEYKLTITRSNPNTDANLSNIKINNSDLTGFAENTTSYTLTDVANNVTSINVEGIKKYNEQKVEVSNNASNLQVGNNAITIKVTAEDTTKTKTYTINVKRKSGVTDLASLSVTTKKSDNTTISGTLSPNFGATTTSYTYQYKEQAAKVSVSATAASPASVTSYEATKSDNTTESNTTGSFDFIPSSVKITVTAEDTSITNEYLIQFSREQSSDKTLKSLSVKDSANKEYITTFNSATKTYTVEVEHEITGVTIAAEANSANAKGVSGTGNVDLTGNNAFSGITKTITVTAEDNTTDSYTVVIKRKKSNNANLGTLSIQGTAVSVSSFDSNLEYTYPSSVGHSVNALTLNYTTENSFASASVSGNSLRDGDNVVTITVKSQDNSVTKEYKIKVKRKSDDSTLNLSVTSNPQGTLVFDHDSTYTYQYDRSVSVVNIVGTNDNGATITGIPTGDYAISNGPVSIEVLPEDGVLKTYTLQFEQIKDTDSSLSNLRVINVDDNTPYPLSPLFGSSPTNEYSLTVSQNTGKVKIEAVKNSNYASIKSGDGEITLKSGENTYPVVVEAEDGSTTTYHLKITKPINTNASLTHLEIGKSGDTLTDIFHSSDTSYRYAVDSTIASVDIHAVGVAGSKVHINGSSNTTNEDTTTINLAIGEEKTITITVDSEDNSAHETYTVAVKRKSNQATLTNLTVDSTPSSTLKPGTNQFAYTLDIPAEVSTITVNATPITGASITNASSLTNIDVTNPSLKEVRVEVQAEDENITNTYIITLNRLKSTNVELGSLVVKNGTEEIATTYDATTHTYQATVGPLVTDITIEATKKLDVQEITGEVGNHTLSDGENTYTITVAAEDRTKTQDYKVVITRTENIDALISSVTVLGNNALWNSTTNQYEVSVDAEASVVNPDDVVVTLTGGTISKKDAAVTLVNGNTVYDYKFEVTATDNTKKEYTIAVSRPLSTDNRLKTFTSDKGTLTKNDGSDINYTLTLPIGTDKFTITAEAYSDYATVLGADEYVVSSLAGNTFNVTVDAENGSQKVYQVEVKFEDSTNNYLSSLIVEGFDGIALDPVFAKETSNYIVNVPNQVTSVTVKATKEDSKATLNMGIDTLTETDTFVANNLIVGETIVKVDVVSEDGVTRNYVVKIVRAGESVPDKITSSTYGHTIDNDYIRTVKIDTTGAELKNQLDNNNEYLEIWTADDSAKVNDGDKLATGMIVKLVINGVEKDRKLIVIRGDVNGDSIVDLLDSVKIVNHFLGKSSLTSAHLEAGYINSDSEVDLLDSVKIVNHFLGKELLN